MDLETYDAQNEMSCRVLDDALSDSDSDVSTSPDFRWRDEFCCAPLPFNAYRSQAEVEEYVRDLDDHWFGQDLPPACGTGTGWLHEPSQRACDAISWSYRAQSVIETDMSILTREEIDKYRSQVEAAMLKDLQSWHAFGCLRYG